MTTYVKLLANKSIITENIQDNTLHNLPPELTIFKKYGYQYAFYGYQESQDNDGNNLSINKHDLPPPIDQILIYGSIFVLKREAKNNDKIVTLSLTEYQDLYDDLFGGFESLGSQDTDEEEEEEYNSEDEDPDYIPPSHTSTDDDMSDYVDKTEETDEETDEDSDEETDEDSECGTNEEDKKMTNKLIKSYEIINENLKSKIENLKSKINKQKKIINKQKKIIIDLKKNQIKEI